MDVAIDEYVEYLSNNSDRAEALTNRALVRRAQGDLAATEADLRRALEQNPSWVPGLVNLADLYRSTGRDLLAGGLLLQAMTLAPQSSQVQVARALWQVRQGDLSQAVATLALGYGQRINASSGYVYAIALNSAGKPDEAIAAIDELLAADLHTRQLLQLGMSLARENRLPERVLQYQQALQRL